MQQPDLIKASLDYIEQNLRTDITAEELAKLAGYSVYHYCRMFSAAMDSSVAGYITKRRLDHALCEISGGRKAIEVVLEYGFDTYAGFFKAFKRMYGCSPKKYVSIYHNHKPKKPEVAKKQMVTEKELRKILENWDIDKNLPIHDIYIMDGAKVSGSVWTVGDDYILKTGQRDRLMKNMRIEKALAGEGFKSSLPVPTKAGEDYLDGQEIFVLTHGLKGNPLPKLDRFGEDRAAFGEKYGRSIAKLHKALKKVQKDVLPDEFNLYQRIMEYSLPAVRAQNAQWNMGLDEAFFSDYIDNFGELYEKLPKQLIHRDPNPSNILFENGEVSGFIDFDISEINIRLWDVCYCATGILSETTDEAYEKWPELFGGILRGYDKEGKLTAAEKQAVYYVVLSIQFICVAYFETREEFKELARINRDMLRYVAVKKEQIKKLVP
jgi:Ser/Thr protein kinase RdoA (MazF antagonist)/AraC-like DNA-binding protein